LLLRAESYECSCGKSMGFGLRSGGFRGLSF
jgi:hypothetical protein